MVQLELFCLSIPLLCGKVEKMSDTRFVTFHARRRRRAKRTRAPVRLTSSSEDLPTAPPPVELPAPPAHQSGTSQDEVDSQEGTGNLGFAHNGDGDDQTDCEENQESDPFNADSAGDSDAVARTDTDRSELGSSPGLNSDAEDLTLNVSEGEIERGERNVAPGQIECIYIPMYVRACQNTF